MAEERRAPRIKVDPAVEASLAEQEKTLPTLIAIRDGMRKLGASTEDIDGYIELASSIIASTRSALERIKKM